MKMLKQLGFSLPEVLLAAGLASGLALVVAKISQNASQVTKTTETNNEINMFMSEVAYALSNKANCNATIPAGSASSGFNPTAIRRVMPDGTIKDIYNAGPDHSYGNGTFRIVSMETEMTSADTVNLVINIERLSKVALGAKEIKKRIPLKVVQDATNTQIVSCFSDTDDIIETAAKAACHGPTARWDDTTKQCFHDVDTTECPPGQMMVGVKGENDQIETECRDILPAASSCPAGSYLKGIDSLGNRDCQPLNTSNGACPSGHYSTGIQDGQTQCLPFSSCVSGVLQTDASGNPRCVDISCGSNQYFVGLDASGSKICLNLASRDCTAGQYVTRVNPNGSYECGNLPPTAMGTAGANQYIRGYQADGTVLANTIPTCTGANYLQFNGTQFQCVPITTASTCTPNCPNAATLCTGETFKGADGCGGNCNVTGTRTCRTICGEANGLSSCTSPAAIEVNYGGVGWEECLHRCTWYFNRNNRKGCWIKSSGNGVCYCRVDGITNWNSTYPRAPGGDCTRVPVN